MKRKIPLEEQGQFKIPNPRQKKGFQTSFNLTDIFVKSGKLLIQISKDVAERLGKKNGDVISESEYKEIFKDDE